MVSLSYIMPGAFAAMLKKKKLVRNHLALIFLVSIFINNSSFMTNYKHEKHNLLKCPMYNFIKHFDGFHVNTRRVKIIIRDFSVHGTSKL